MTNTPELIEDSGVNFERLEQTNKNSSNQASLAMPRAYLMSADRRQAKAFSDDRISSTQNSLCRKQPSIVLAQDILLICEQD